MKLSSPLKIYGGKYYLAKQLHAMWPKHDRLFDLFGGAGNMMIQRLCSQGVVNDLHPLRAALFYRLSIPQLAARLMMTLSQLDYTEATFWKHCNMLDSGTSNDAVVSFIVRSRMSRGGMGKEFGYSVRERNGTPGDVNAWNNMITSIPLLHERFQNVCVRNFCAMKLLREIEFQDGDVVYLDPPYVKDTRVTPDAYGEEEMSEEQHLALLTLVAPFEVPTMISGYSHPMYNSMLSKWNRYEIKTVAHSGQSLTKTPRTEIVWTNYRRF